MIDMKNRILVMVLTMVMVLVMISGCSSGVEEINEDVQLQASENLASTGEVKPSEGKAEASDKEEPTSEEAPKGSSGDLTEVSKASEGSSSAPTEPATETTAPATQPTQPTQPTIPVVTEPPHQHSYSATVIAPTCNEKGYTKYTCACGYSYNDNYTAALGHHYIDEVIAPTTSAQGYTKHTCDRCWYSYTDSYTPVLVQEWWDTEDVVAAICAEGNAYIESLGLIVDPSSSCWVAPDYTRWEGSNANWLRNSVFEAINMYHADGFTNMYVTYEPDPTGGWIVYVKHQLTGFSGWG